MTPSPENPVEIESFECAKFSSTNNLLTFSNVGIQKAFVNSSGAVQSEPNWNISKYFDIPENAKEVAVNMHGNAPAICFYDVSKEYISGTAYGNQTIITLNIPENAKYVRFSFPTGFVKSNKVVFDDEFSNIYEKSITLRSLPDGTCDEYKDDKIIRRLGEITFDGSSDEAWFTRGDKMGYAITVNDARNNTIVNQVLCNRGRFTPIGAATKGNTILDGSRNISYYMGGEALDLTEWRSFLSQNPLTYVYPLDTPVIEDVSIPILPSQHPYTQVYTDSPIDTDIEWEILTSSNNDAQIEELLARVSALESEAVNAQN